MIFLSIFMVRHGILLLLQSLVFADQASPKQYTSAGYSLIVPNEPE